MRKIVLTFGLISSVVICGMMITNFLMHANDMNFDNAELFGYIGMILGFATIFPAIHSYREKHLGGSISFGKAFQIGLYISLIATFLYVVTWMIYSSYHPEFMDNYFEYSVQKIRESGQSAEAIEAQIAEMKQGMEMYKNPLVKIGFTIIEILPVGLLISLIAAAILKKKDGAQVASSN